MTDERTDAVDLAEALDSTTWKARRVTLLLAATAREWLDGRYLMLPHAAWLGAC